MDGWHGDDLARDEREDRQARWRMIAGQAIVVVLVAGALGFRLLQSTPEPPKTASAPAATAIAVRPSLGIPTRVDVEVPNEVSIVGRRFLLAISRSEFEDALRDVAVGQPARLDAPTKLASVAGPFVTAKTRNFRVQYWQPATETEQARLVVGFDYDRLDQADGRSRVTLRIIQQVDRWYVTELDIGLWMADLGLSPR